ncbi:MAG: hypothetical protein ABGZ53_11440 [Fuerstiella sp.]
MTYLLKNTIKVGRHFLTIYFTSAGNLINNAGVPVSPFRRGRQAGEAAPLKEI